MIAINNKYAKSIPGSIQILCEAGIRLKHLQCDIEYFGTHGREHILTPDLYTVINLHYNADEARNHKSHTRQVIKRILQQAKQGKIIFTGDFNAAFRRFKTTEAIVREFHDLGFLSFGIPNRDIDEHYHGEPCFTTILIPRDRDPAQHFPILIKPSIYMERNPALIRSTPGHPNNNDPHHAQRTHIPGPTTTKSPIATHRAIQTPKGHITTAEDNDSPQPQPSKVQIQQQLRKDAKQNTTIKPGFTEAEIFDMSIEDRVATDAWTEMSAILQLTTACEILQLDIPTVGDFLQPTYYTITVSKDKPEIYTAYTSEDGKLTYQYEKEHTYPLPNKIIGPVLEVLTPKHHFDKAISTYNCDMFVLIPHRKDPNKYEAVPIVLKSKIISRPVPGPHQPTTETLHHILRQGVLSASVFQKYFFTKDIVRHYHDRFEKYNITDIYDNYINDTYTHTVDTELEATESESDHSDIESPQTKLTPYTAPSFLPDKSAKRLTSEQQQQPVLPTKSNPTSPSAPASSASAAMEVDQPQQDTEMKDVKLEQPGDLSTAATAAIAAAEDSADTEMTEAADASADNDTNVVPPFDEETLLLYDRTEGSGGPFKDYLNIFHVLDTADDKPPYWWQTISRWMSGALRFRHQLDAWLSMDVEAFKSKLRVRYPEYIQGKHGREVYRNHRPLYVVDGFLHHDSSDATFLAWMRYMCFPKLRWEFTTKDGIPMGTSVKIRRIRAIQGHGPHDTSPQFRNLVKVTRAKIGWHTTTFHHTLDMIRNNSGFLLTKREEGYFSLSDPTITIENDDYYYRHPRPFTEEDPHPYVYDTGTTDTQCIIAIDLELGRERGFDYYQTISLAMLCHDNHDLDYFIMIKRVQDNDLIYGFDTQDTNDMHLYYLLRKQRFNLDLPDEYKDLPPPQTARPLDNILPENQTCGLCHLTSTGVSYVCPSCRRYRPNIMRLQPETKQEPQDTTETTDDSQLQPVLPAPADQLMQINSPPTQISDVQPHRKGSIYNDFIKRAFRKYRQAIAAGYGSITELSHSNDNQWADFSSKHGESAATCTIYDKWIQLRLEGRSLDDKDVLSGPELDALQPFTDECIMERELLLFKYLDDGGELSNYRGYATSVPAAGEQQQQTQQPSASSRQTSRGPPTTPRRQTSTTRKQRSQPTMALAKTLLRPTVRPPFRVTNRHLPLYANAIGQQPRKTTNHPPITHQLHNNKIDTTRRPERDLEQRTATQQSRLRPQRLAPPKTNTTTTTPTKNYLATLKKANVHKSNLTENAPDEIDQNENHRQRPNLRKPQNHSNKNQLLQQAVDHLHHLLHHSTKTQDHHNNTKRQPHQQRGPHSDLRQRNMQPTNAWMPPPRRPPAPMNNRTQAEQDRIEAEVRQRILEKKAQAAAPQQSWTSSQPSWTSHSWASYGNASSSSDQWQVQRQHRPQTQCWPQPTQQQLQQQPPQQQQTAYDTTQPWQRSRTPPPRPRTPQTRPPRNQQHYQQYHWQEKHH